MPFHLRSIFSSSMSRTGSGSSLLLKKNTDDMAAYEDMLMRDPLASATGQQHAPMRRPDASRPPMARSVSGRAHSARSNPIDIPQARSQWEGHTRGTQPVGRTSTGRSQPAVSAVCSVASTHGSSGAEGGAMPALLLRRTTSSRQLLVRPSGHHAHSPASSYHSCEEHGLAHYVNTMSPNEDLPLPMVTPAATSDSGHLISDAALMTEGAEATGSASARTATPDLEDNSYVHIDHSELDITADTLSVTSDDSDDDDDDDDDCAHDLDDTGDAQLDSSYSASSVGYSDIVGIGSKGAYGGKSSSFTLSDAASSSSLTQHKKPQQQHHHHHSHQQLGGQLRHKTLARVSAASTISRPDSDLSQSAHSTTAEQVIANLFVDDDTLLGINNVLQSQHQQQHQQQQPQQQQQHTLPSPPASKPVPPATDMTSPVASAPAPPLQRDSTTAPIKVPARGSSVKNGRYVFNGRRLGSGTFGEVHEGLDTKSGKRVAIKLCKTKDRVILKQAQNECFLMDLIEHECASTAARETIVAQFDSWVEDHRFIMVYELLSMNMYQYIQSKPTRCLDLVELSRFAKDLLRALRLCAQPNLSIIHADIKPENIALTMDRKHCKLIDFGSACTSDHKIHSYIQSRYYRSPEVLLGIEYTSAIDMWSVGCVLLEAHTGAVVFPGKSSPDQMRHICSYLGKVPEAMFRMALKKKREKLFERVNPEDGLEGFTRDSDTFPVMEDEQGHVYTCPPKTQCLSAFILPAQRYFTKREKATHTDTVYRHFLDLCSQMLVWEPHRRLTPQQALEHPFFTTLEQACRSR